MADNIYVHGYTERESQRLVEQSEALTDLLHEGTRYPPGALVLDDYDIIVEAGAADRACRRCIVPEGVAAGSRGVGRSDRTAQRRDDRRRIRGRRGYHRRAARSERRREVLGPVDDRWARRTPGRR